MALDPMRLSSAVDWYFVGHATYDKDDRYHGKH